MPCLYSDLVFVLFLVISYHSHSLSDGLKSPAFYSDTQIPPFFRLRESSAQDCEDAICDGEEERANDILVRLEQEVELEACAAGCLGC